MAWAQESARDGDTEPVNIRPATQLDAPGAVATVKEVFDEFGFTWEAEGYHADLYDLEGHYLGPGHGFWVVELEGRIVGTAGLIVREAFPDEPPVQTVEGAVRLGGTDCEMARLYVRPAARGQGVGRALAQRVADEARERGCRAMEIWSDKRFVDAHRLYQKLGAVVVADRVSDDPDLSPEWGLVLRLR